MRQSNPSSHRLGNDCLKQHPGALFSGYQRAMRSTMGMAWNSDRTATRVDRARPLPSPAHEYLVRIPTAHRIRQPSP